MPGIISLNFNLTLKLESSDMMAGRRWVGF